MPAAAGNHIQKMREADLYDEEGFREWCKHATALGKDFMNELSYGSTMLYQILQNTPVANPRTGPMSGGNDAKAYARKVRAYLSRAAQSSEYASGQVAGAWKVVESGFLAPSSAVNRGMNTGNNKRGA